MSESTSPTMGTHVIVDVYDCWHPLLDDASGLEMLLREAAVASGATVLSGHHHTFEPHGATALCVLAESHISIHTWPEHGTASLDAYTCGETADPVAAVNHVVTALAPGRIESQVIERGTATIPAGIPRPGA